MTAAEQITFIESILDELVSGNTPTFWINPADYYIALSDAQRNVVADLVDRKEWHSMMDLIVSESVTDGGTLANKALVVCSGYDLVNHEQFLKSPRQIYNLTHSITLAHYNQFYVEDNVLHTQPTGRTLMLRYIKSPADISGSQDSTISKALHFRLCELASHIMLEKDMTAPMQELIEDWRDKMSIMSKKKGTPEVPTIPYQQQ